MDEVTSQPTRGSPTLPAKVGGKIGWILLWLLGIPIPVLFALFLLRGCT